MIQTDSNVVTAIKPTARSRVTNGSALLPGVDGRSTWVRRTRDLILAHTNDLGGVDMCSQAELSIIRRASCLTTEMELLEKSFAEAGSATAQQLDLYGRTASTLRRLLESIGLQRRSKAVGLVELMDGTR